MRRYLKKMHLAAVSCLVLAGCGGGGGGTATAVLNLMVETLTGGTFSADALSVSRFQSITTDWRQLAQDLRNTALYQTQQFSWYVDSNNNAARDPATEPLFNSFSIASSPGSTSFASPVSSSTHVRQTRCRKR